MSLEVQIALLGRLQGHLMGYLFLQHPWICGARQTNIAGLVWIAGRAVLRSRTGRRGRCGYLMPINTVLRSNIARLQQGWVLRGRGECHAALKRHSRDTRT